MHLAGTWDASSWGYYTLNRPPLCETVKHSRAAQHHHQVCMYVRGMNMHNAAAYTDHSNQYIVSNCMFEHVRDLNSHVCEIVDALAPAMPLS